VSTRRRTGLHQDRSRQTRQRLIRAAVELWTERGFEQGVASTTVEEIAQAAGVTKGTFYFHFSRKEEILLALGFGTAEVANNEVQKCIDAGCDVAKSLHHVTATLASHISRAPRAAVARTVSEFHRTPTADLPAHYTPGFSAAFQRLFEVAAERGEVTGSVGPPEMARMLTALVMDSIVAWADGEADLQESLSRRAAILVRGLSPGR